MRLIKYIHKNSSCYKAQRKITPKGIMVHSTGANNPYLRRYVGTHKELGTNVYNNGWNRTMNAAVHAWIGYDKNEKIATVQTLPWNHRGWHCGRSGNDTHISFEICEDNLTNKTYFNAVYKEAVELTAMLCKEYKLDPLKHVLDHAEGYKKGIANNHADVGHWFKKHGKSMNIFRTDVNKEMNKSTKKYELVVDLDVYVSSKNALARKNPVKKYKKGTYYVFNEVAGAVNVTKTAGSPGGWVNIKDNVKPKPVEPPKVETPKEDKPKEEVKEVIEKPIEETIKDTIITENEFDEIIESDILKTDKNIFIKLLEKLIELITNIFKK